MQRYMLAAVLCMCISTASASDLLWRGSTPSGKILSGADMVGSSNCYPTIRRLQGKRYYHPMECREKAKNHMDIGIPLDGPIIKMPREATRIYIRKDGWIVLK